MRTRTAVIAVLIAAVCAACAHAAPSAGGGQISTGPSCMVSCITSALIEPHTGAFGVSVHTDTPATILIAVYDPTTNAVLGWSLSPAGRTAWAGHVTGLAPDTTYRVTIKASDAQGHTDTRSTLYRTLAVQTTQPLGPGGIQSSVGCSEDCFASVKLAPQGTSVGVTVDTTVPAQVKVSVDRDAPGTIGDAPFFGTPEAEAANAQYATHWNASLDDLVPGSTYHVILRATDSDGHSSYVSGLFATKHRVAALVLEGIRVYYDGDKGANRGELRFDAAVNQVDEPSVRIKERKVASGNWLTFGHHGRLTYFPQSRGLNIAVQAKERDSASSRWCFETIGTGVISPDSGRTDERCNKWTWVTVRGVLDLDAPAPYGRRDFTLMTSNTAGIRFVVEGHVDVRYE